MNTKNKFWWFVVIAITITLTILVALAILVWHQLLPQQRDLLVAIFSQHLIYLFSAFLLIVAGLGFALDGIFHNYIIPIIQLTEEIGIINAVNPSHRIRIEGSREIQRLGQSINEGADRIENLQKSVQQQVLQGKSDLEDEKSTLAAIIADLPEGVLVCNAEGQITLYNNQARRFLETSGQIESVPQGRPMNFLGLGRSVFGVIDEHLLNHALDEIKTKLTRKESNPVAYFVVIGSDNKLLRSEAVPIINRKEQFKGFILILHDITRQLESDSHVTLLLSSLTTRIRASLSSIRAAIEAMLEYPRMADAQRAKFQEIIHKETLLLGELIEKNSAARPELMRTHWPHVVIPASELVEMLRQKAADKLDLLVNTEKGDPETWISVDGYSMILALLFILNHLRRETTSRVFNCRVKTRGDFVHVDLTWQGSPVKVDTLRNWYKQPLVLENEGLPLTLKEVIGHHEAEIWSAFRRKEDNLSYLRLYLPVRAAPTPTPPRSPHILKTGRPEFYDFDLFNQPGQSPELDNRALGDLTYTVFDTETTGLDPRGGDEIISIGAVRIVNGNLLKTESFDRLVDPQRSIPHESIRIHGIPPELLVGKPTIEQILPLFHRFAQDTVLVAHNAAFDLRMLQMKEAATGIKFINPVLDTMLLSAVVHPAQANHDLEPICQRLGITVKGRHTALGDAVATAEILLKLIPLLAEQGVFSLKEARIASQKSYYARRKY